MNILVGVLLVIVFFEILRNTTFGIAGNNRAILRRENIPRFLTEEAGSRLHASNSASHIQGNLCRYGHFRGCGHGGSPSGIFAVSAKQLAAQIPIGFCHSTSFEMEGLSRA